MKYGLNGTVTRGCAGGLVEEHRQQQLIASSATTK